ncbi:MAG TPA: hypothetical protein VJZ71_04775 [Phycisphaerae bacterium]|nr:hypothetical protein [Phycisphaerae bacterium]
MNKKTLVLSAALLTILSSTVMAQSVIWLDVRPNDSGSTIRTISGNVGVTATNPFLNAAGNGDALNGGRRGQGQTLYIEPKANDGWESMNVSTTRNANSFPNFDGDLNHSTGDLWIYMDVLEDLSGAGDVISSVGLDIDTRLVGATMRNKIASMAVTLDNANTVFNSITPAGASPWNNKVDGNVVPNDPPDWEKAKAVRVPVDPGPTYNASLGITPRDPVLANTTPYRLGKIRLTSGTRNCSGRTAPAFNDNSTYDIFLKVNNLLITRVYNGAGDAVEDVQFGYSGATPEAPPVSGNSAGAVSLVADGRVQVRLKGDFTGDGNVTGADVGGFNGAVNDAAENQLQTYLGDFNGNNTTTGADIGAAAGGTPPFTFFQGAVNRSGIASCP